MFGINIAFVESYKFFHNWLLEFDYFYFEVYKSLYFKNSILIIAKTKEWAVEVEQYFLLL